MRSNIFYILCLITIFFWSCKAFAQDEKECIERLNQVKRAYESGEIDKQDNINAIEQCLPYLARQNKIEAYKYLTLINLYRNENPQAKENMITFLKLKLKKEPDYDPKTENPENKVPEFIELYNRLSHWADFFIGMKAGLNRSQMFIIKTFSTENSTGVDNNKKDRIAEFYTPKLSLQFGLSFELPLGHNQRKLSVLGEIFLSNIAYEFNDNLMNFATVTATETQRWLEVPLMLQYTLGKGKTRGFLNLGGSFSYLSASNLEISRVDNVGGNDRKVEAAGFNTDIKAKRQNINFNAISGAGIRFRNFAKTGGDLIVEGRYYFPLLNMVKSDERYAKDIQNNQLIYDYGFVDSDFKLGRAFFSVGFVLPFYNPKQISSVGNYKSSFDN